MGFQMGFAEIHQGFQMGFAEIYLMHLNELCSKFHCTKVNLDVNVV